MSGMAPGEGNLKLLLQRFNIVLQKLDRIEQELGLTHEEKIEFRQNAVLDRIAKLEALTGCVPAQAQASCPPEERAPPDLQMQGTPARPPVAAEGHPPIPDPAASPVQKRLAAELAQRGITNHRFVRCPPEYYHRPLEFRRQCLQAHSIQHLCKTIIMENTRAHPSVDGWANPRNSKYYIVLVQYAARLNAEKLKSFIHKMNAGKIGKKFFNMRLAPEEVSDQLSGFTHNAVTPIGIKTRLPIIMSHKISQLRPDFFFLGAGEVDLKVGFSASEFMAAYDPYVVDCTYEEGEEAPQARQAGLEDSTG